MLLYAGKFAGLTRFHPRCIERMNGRLVDLVFGYDFFISYRWDDARPYAVALEEKLKELGYICFLDSKEYPVGANWRTAGQRALIKSGKLVLIASPGALDSNPVYDEIDFYLNKVGGPIHAIDIGETLAGHPEHRLTTLIGGAANIWVEEPLTVLEQPNVEATATRLHASFELLRQDRWRSQVFGAIAAILFVLACGLGFFAWEAKQQRAQALTHLCSAQENERIAKTNEAEARQLVAAADFRFAQEAIARGVDAEAVAFLARGLRQGPPTPRLQTRLLTLLTQRAWAFPVAVTEYLGGFEGPRLSADGQKMLAHRDQDQEAVVELLTGKVLFQLSGLPDIRQSAFSPDGQLICAASPNEAGIWPATGGMPKKKIPLPGIPTALEIAPNSGRVAIGIADGRMVIYDLVQDVHFATVAVGKGPLVDLQFSRDSQRLMTVDGDRTARLHEVATSQVLATLEAKGEKLKIRRAKFTPDGEELVTASLDTLDVWNARDGSHLLSAPASAINDFDIALSGSFLVAAHGLEMQQPMVPSQSNTGLQPLIQLRPGSGQRWTVNLLGEMISATRYPHQADVFGVALPPNQQHPARTATASWDFTARIWPVREDLYGIEVPLNPAAKKSAGEMEIALPSPPLWHGAPVNSVAYTPDGSHLVTHSLDGKATVWTGRPGRVEARHHLLPSPVERVALHRLKSRAALVTEDGSLHWIDAETAQPAGPPIPDLKPAAIAWQADGEALWATDDAGKLRRIPWLGVAIDSVALAGAGSIHAWRQDGSLLVRGGESPEVMLIRPDQASQIQRTLTLPAPCREAVFSADGTRLLILSGAEKDQAGQLTLWETGNGTQLGQWATAKAEGPLNFGGERATRGLHQIEVFDLQTSGSAARDLDFPLPAGVCTLSQDGQRLAVCLSDVNAMEGYAMIFDPVTLAPVARTTQLQAASAAAFDSSSTRLVTVEAMGRTQCWDSETGVTLADPFGQALEGSHKNTFVGFFGTVEGLFRVSGSSIQAIHMPPLLDLSDETSRNRLAAFAEMLAQCRIDNGSQPKHLTPSEALAARTALLNPASPVATLFPLENLLQWLMADPVKRTLAPWSTRMVEEYWLTKVEAAPPAEHASLQEFVADWPVIAQKLADLQSEIEAAKTPQRKSEEAFRVGKILAGAGHFQEAASRFAEAIQWDPENFDAVGEGTQAVLLLGNVDEALKIIAEARKDDPQNRTLLRYEARLHFLAKKPELALKLFESLDRERDDRTPRPLVGLAISHWSSDQQDQALELYAELVKGDANYQNEQYVARLDFPEAIRETLLEILDAYVAKAGGQ